MREPSTSVTHRLRVDFVPASALGRPGRLGVTFAPGKKDRGAVFAAWDRDLQADLRRLREVYRASLLVSLVEDGELALLGIGELVEQAARLGLEVLRHPIVDGAAPELSGARGLVGRILDALDAGRNVVIHCRGGLGRAGTLAAATLVAQGATAAEATAIVRAARPGAVETAAQEAFVAGFANAWGAPRTAPATAPALDRVHGCLLGGAVGDALGYPVEFVARGRTILERYGSPPPATLGYANGERVVSDDTQMTLFTAEGLIRAGQRGRQGAPADAVPAVNQAYLRWYLTQTGEGRDRFADPACRGWLLGERRLFARRAPGNTCLSALRATAGAPRVPGVASRPNDSKGCGAVMRAAPAGLWARSREAAFALGRDTGVLTHGHPSGYLSAAYFAAVVFDAARGEPLADAMTAADALLTREPEHAELRAAMEAARALARGGPPSAAALEAYGGGWVGEEALAIALVCALTAEARTPEGVAWALWRAAAHGGDSDSTAALTGNLLGAMVGVAGLPSPWREEVELGDVVARLAGDLHASGVLGQELDFEAYPPR